MYKSCSSPIPASAVHDNWCQKWDVQRRDDGSKKATLHGSSGVHTVKETCRQVLGGRNLPRPTTTYAAAITTMQGGYNE